MDPKAAGDAVMSRLINVCTPEVKGAHDADMLIADGRAYIVFEANNERPGENPGWDFIYAALSVVDLATMTLEKMEIFAESNRAYANATLPSGCCFVPRIVPLGPSAFRCFFASEAPGKRESKTWYIDYDMTTQSFNNEIYPVELETSQGVFHMGPNAFHGHAKAAGFTRPVPSCGLCLVDGVKEFDGELYMQLNNFEGKQLGLAKLDDVRNRLIMIGNYFEPIDAELSESAVNILPDGTWCAISRQDANDKNYLFATSPDGMTWAPHEERDFVQGGTSSKPTFDRFGDTYYLGWQEKPGEGRNFRAIFNLDISTDCVHWTRRFRFDTDKSFQYPVFKEYEGEIYCAVTQGDSDPSRKERILFGKLIADNER